MCWTMASRMCAASDVPGVFEQRWTKRDWFEVVYRGYGDLYLSFSCTCYVWCHVRYYRQSFLKSILACQASTWRCCWLQLWCWYFCEWMRAIPSSRAHHWSSPKWWVWWLRVWLQNINSFHWWFVLKQYYVFWYSLHIVLFHGLRTLLNLCIQILFGIALILLSSFALLDKPATVKCGVFVWMDAIGTAFILVSMIVKTYRWAYDDHCITIITFACRYNPFFENK